MVLVPLGILGVGVALGLHLARRARSISIPILFGFGLLMASDAIDLLDDGPFLQGATDVGLLLMLFYTSLFGNPRALRDGGRIGLPLAAYDLVVNFAVAWWIGAHLGWDVPERLFLAGILATSSTAVVLKILGDEGRITRREGNVLVSLLLIEDWVFLGFYAFLGLRYGGVTPRSAESMVFGVLGFVAFLVVLRLLRHLLWSVQSRELLVALLTSLGLLGAFLGMMAGLPGVGSAFTTGLVLSGEEGARFSQREAPYLRDAAAAVFFVGYGALLGPQLSANLVPLLGLCLAGVVVSELLFLPVLARRLGLRRSESFIAGALLMPRGGKSAAFAKLYPNTPDSPPLFPLAGLLAVVLTPLAPLVVKIGIRFAGRASKASLLSPGESFSRSARSLLMPTTYVQRSNVTALDRVVLAELVGLNALLSVLTLTSAPPISWAAALALLVGLIALLDLLRSWVRRSPGSPLVTHPRVGPRQRNPAFDHLPFLLIAPMALLLGLAVASPWAIPVYPILVGGLWVAALGLPWIRRVPKRAPPLSRALQT